MSIEQQKFYELEKVLTIFETSRCRVREKIRKILKTDQDNVRYDQMNVQKLLEDFHVDTFCEQIQNKTQQEQIQQIEEKIGQFQSIIDELWNIQRVHASEIVEYYDHIRDYGYLWYWGVWDSISFADEFGRTSCNVATYFQNIDQQIKDLGTQVYLLKEAKEKIIETQKAVTNPA